jgi:single-strand selective monofunctional uracil DNA glycosylase
VEFATSKLLIKQARQLSSAVDQLKFKPPVTHVYNPLQYARAAHEIYLQRYGNGPKRVLFLGMNPGPFGMAQTGIPFGQIAAVRDWLGIQAKIGRPDKEHPKRPVLGFDCHRSEVSGERLWSLFARRFGSAQNFFQHHLVMNYCPLAFIEESGRNRTPDKLPRSERDRLFQVCDHHLREIAHILQSEWIVGVGEFAAKRAQSAFAKARMPIRLGQILHPSPSCPASNVNWAGKVTAQLCAIGVWSI